MKKEIWLPVVGFEGLYEVSNKGVIRQTGNLFTGAKKQRRTNKGIKKQSTQTMGYKTVCFSTHKRELVHRVVAKAFIPNPLGLKFVNHKDWDKSNNCVENLEWCTHKNNLIHAFKNPKALQNAKSPAKINGALKSSRDRAMGINVFEYKTGNFVGYFESVGVCTKELGLSSYSNIYMVLNGTYKQYLGYTFQKVIKTKNQNK